MSRESVGDDRPSCPVRLHAARPDRAAAGDAASGAGALGRRHWAAGRQARARRPPPAQQRGPARLPPPAREIRLRASQTTRCSHGEPPHGDGSRSIVRSRGPKCPPPQSAHSWRSFCGARGGARDAAAKPPVRAGATAGSSLAGRVPGPGRRRGAGTASRAGRFERGPRGQQEGSGRSRAHAGRGGERWRTRMCRAGAARRAPRRPGSPPAASETAEARPPPRALRPGCTSCRGAGPSS